VGGNYLPTSTPSLHALPPPSPRDSACAWLTNLPIHSLPTYFTSYIGYERQRLRDEGLSICCIIFGHTSQVDWDPLHDPIPEGLLQAARLDVQVEGHELLLPLVSVGTPAADLLVGEGALEHTREDLLLVHRVQILVHLFSGF
jgi:hypothetical protein